MKNIKIFLAVLIAAIGLGFKQASAADPKEETNTISGIEFESTMSHIDIKFKFNKNNKLTSIKLEDEFYGDNLDTIKVLTSEKKDVTKFGSASFSKSGSKRVATWIAGDEFIDEFNQGNINSY